jgi:hypothetical protein
MPRLLKLRSPSPSALSYSTVYKYPQRLRVVLSIERELLDLYHTLHTNKKVNVIYFIKISRIVCLPFQPAHWFLLFTYPFILSFLFYLTTLSIAQVLRHLMTRWLVLHPSCVPDKMGANLKGVKQK